MKLRIFLLIFLLHLASALEAQEKYVVTWDYKGLTFTEFALKAKELLNVRFFYKDEWVSHIMLGDYNGSNSLQNILDKLLQGKSLFYYIDDYGNVILTLNYSVNITGNESKDTGNFIAPTEIMANRDDQKLRDNLIVDLGNPAERNKPGNVIISGYISNKDTKEPVSGVTVYSQKLFIGTISNEYGFYSLTLPRGVHVLQFSFMGMKGKVINLNLYGAGELNVDLASVLIPLKEAIVSAQKSMTIRRFEVGAEKINIHSFKLMPTSMGESDIIKNLLFLPGVQSPGEGSAGFNVRGGSADQNLILLYGAPIYNSSHFFGFFSAVNSDVIKDVTLYKGGIPGRYGGRISSVLDIGAKEGNRKEFAGNAGISPITAHMSMEGPLIKDTLTYILTARTTYSNWIFNLIDNVALARSRASFYDINGKITWDLNKNNKIDLSSYFSHDAFRFNSDTVYSYDNNIVALKWRHFFNSKFFSTVSLNNSFYNYDISSDYIKTEAFILSHKINSTGLKADFNWFRGRHELNFGLDLNNYSVSPGTYLPEGDSSLVIPKIITRERALEGALYFDDKFVLNDFLSINTGIRLSSFYSFGPRSLMIYDPDYSRTLSTITDTLKIKNGETVSKYGGPELRISFNFRISEKSSVKLNYNRTLQYLHLLTNSASISPSDTWKLSDFYLKPQKGDQVAIGYYFMMFNSTLEASAEMYYKYIRNMVDFKGGTKLIMNGNIEKDALRVKGKAYGLELVLKKTEGKIRYTVGYTYARSFRRSTGLFSDEIINSGQWFPSNFDKPHDLSVTFNYLLSRRFSLSSGYTYSTGRPITYPVAQYFIGDKLFVHYSDRNKYRIPDYSRLDISLRIGGNLKSRRIAHPFWTFSVYNLLGRENVYSIYFAEKNNRINGYKLSIFSNAVPSVTFSFDF